MAILNNYLKSIANAIRNKTGKVEFINAQNFASEIENMEPKYDTLEITKNGIFDVKDYKNAQVVVPSNDFETIKKILERSYGNEVEIPYGVTKLGKYAVATSDYSSFKLTIPNTITQLVDYAIIPNNHYNIYFNGTLEEWFSITKSDYAFGASADKQGYRYNLYTNNTKVENIDFTGFSQIPKLTSMILKSVYIPNTITSLDYYTFNYSYIDKITFQDNNSLTKIYLYEVKSQEIKINEGATYVVFTFLNHKPSGGAARTELMILPSTLSTLILKPSVSTSTSTVVGTMILNSTTPPTLSSNSYTTINKIWVPKGTLETYKSATNWSVYASKIFSKLSVFFNVDTSLINNANVTYSIDDGALQQFTDPSFQKDDIYKLVISNKDSNTTILVGTTQGGSDLATISNATTTINISTDTNIYITKQ